MSSVQKKTTRTTKTVTTKTTEHVQTSSLDQSADVQSSVTQKTNNLSIVRKGQFFDDSYFEDTRQDFQDAVTDVLAKWGDKSKPSNDINSYRDLRARDLRDENQAIKTAEDQRYHKIVVDVQDFINGGEVSVKTLDEEEIVVEGRVERKVGNTRSTKSFKRTFILSDIVPESITSVVSADGILIIKALKKECEMDVSESVTVKKTVVKQQQQTVQTSGQQTVTPPPVAGPQPDQEKTVSVTKQVTSTTTDARSKPLPIVKKGGFFEDAFFEDCRQHFQQAVKQVLRKCNVTSTQTDDLTAYRNLRQQDLREENQVATVDDEELFQKIIVDVKDFLNGGEVTVKTVEEREVVIEGRVERQEGNKKTIKRFCKRFILPEDILVEAVTSVVSSDGVLTVTAPRKPSETQDTDVSQTVTVQKTVVKKQQTSTVETSGQEQDIKKTDVQVKQTDTVAKKVITDTQQTKTTTTKTVTITTTKSTFFEDQSFVEDVKDFQEAILSIIKKLNLTVTEKDVFTVYRNYRKNNPPKNENQAVSEKETDITKKIVMDVCDFIGGVTVTVDEHLLTIEGKGNRHTESGGVQTFRFNRQYCLPVDANPDDITAVLTSEGILIITIIRRKSVTSSTVTKKTTDKSVTVTITTTKSTFFEDQNFVEEVKDFQEAIRIIVKKLNLTVTEKDVFTVYRNYRKNNPPKNENQAVSEKETDTTKKIVIDVSDFTENVTVKVVDHELVIEGQGKRPTDTGAIQTFNFNRRFSLPDDVNPEDVTAVVSSEGILIITIIRRRIVKVTKVKKDTTEVQEAEPKKPITEKDDTQLTKTTTTTTKTTKTVTITTTKSTFFEDQTFVEDVKDFQEAIRIIIKKLNLKVTEKDVFTVYRNYRKNNPPKNENQAVSEKETDTTKKIVIDVSDFTENVTVKVVDHELVVEGQGKRPTDTGAIQTFNFNRHFCLPDDVNPEDITAVVSSEGILIITIIRRRIVKVTKVKKDTTETDETQKTKTTTTTTKTVTITTKGPFFKDSTFAEDVKNFEQAITTIIKKFNLKITETDAYTTYRNYRKTNPKNQNQAVSEKETDKTKKVVIDVCDFSENVTVSVEKSELVIEGEGKRQTAGGAIQTFSFNRHFCLPEGATTDDVTAVKSSEGILSVTIKKTVTSSLTTTTMTQESTVTGKVIKITVKGPFFSDPAFAESVKEFQSSITTLIKKFSVKVTGGTDAFTAYRNYRKENPKNENQAVSVNETETVKKVVMDVCDFVGAVTVKLEGKEVVVSGTGHRQKGGTGPVITFSFGRRFSLYDDTILDAITAVMSSEGILTITIPRKQ